MKKLSQGAGKSMKKLRDKLNYANVMATIAVFIALGGSAYAATQLQKNSVGARQLKKGSVNSAKVKDHSLQTQDFKPGQLPAGPQGAAGQPFDANATLPSGQTLSGPWALSGTGAPSSAQTQIQFAPKLAAPIASSRVQFHYSSGPFSPACPGPGRAVAGYFCVYENAALGMSFIGASSVESVEARGMVISYSVTGPNASAYGSWAVTAP